jgi:hypothetical protein
MLKTKNLRDSRFRTIRQIRTKAEVETRIEHADCRSADRKRPVKEDAFHDGPFELLSGGAPLQHRTPMRDTDNEDAASFTAPQ